MNFLIIIKNSIYESGYKSKESKANKIPAVVHVDGTARAHTVSKRKMKNIIL